MACSQQNSLADLWKVFATNFLEDSDCSVIAHDHWVEICICSDVCLGCNTRVLIQCH